jgi:hypothetical protein
MSGRYVVRDELVRGVEVTAVWWAGDGEPAVLLVNLARDRVPLLAEALARYLAGHPAGD